VEKIDAKILEMMMSRLCHEFVGPVGAVANGIELIQETDGAIAAEAVGMVDISAKELTARIKFYRVAYGVSGITSNNLAELRGLSISFVGGEGTVLRWPMPPMAPKLEEGEGKLVINMIALAKGALSRGGEVCVDIVADSLSVSAVGESVGLSDDLVSAITSDVNLDLLNPRNVHGFWATLLAKNVGRKLRYDVIGSKEIRISA